MGSEMLKMLVVSASIFSMFDRAVLKHFSMERFWAHSQAASKLAGAIASAEKAETSVVETARMGGLLHDIGRVLMASSFPAQFGEAQRLAKEGAGTLCEVEKRVIGASHAEFGAYLLNLWGLPELLVEAVAWHHLPQMCPHNSFHILTGVHVADALLQEVEEYESTAAGAALDLEYIGRLNLLHRLPDWRKLRDDTWREQKHGE